MEIIDTVARRRALEALWGMVDLANAVEAGGGGGRDWTPEITALQNRVTAVEDNKQNRLTAGSGIEIVENTISADLSDYYTRTQIDATKQDKLTAGTGITIQNNVISSTGGGTNVTVTPLSDGTYQLNFD